MKLSYLVRGWPGHPLHPPLTAISLGAYTSVVVFCAIYFAGPGEPALAKSTGTFIATVMFIYPSSTNEPAFKSGVITTGAFASILAVYGVMAFGGWLGGKLVFVFGYRVLPAEGSGSGVEGGR